MMMKSRKVLAILIVATLVLATFGSALVYMLY
jgi:hypothetical protein